MAAGLPHLLRLPRSAYYRTLTSIHRKEAVEVLVLEAPGGLHSQEEQGKATGSQLSDLTLGCVASCSRSACWVEGSDKTAAAGADSLCCVVPYHIHRI